MFDRKNLLLYAITDRKGETSEEFYKKIYSALQGGITCLQLREKNLEISDFIKEAKKVKALCIPYNVPLIINDNFEVAIKGGADGVHVGQDDMSVKEIRKAAGADFIIGATAKTPQQAQAAEKDGADYLGVGAVFPSPTKSKAIRISRPELDEICLSVSIPAVAIGGINENNIETLKSSKIAGIAVVSAIFGAEDVENTTQRIKDIAYDLFGLY